MLGALTIVGRVPLWAWPLAGALAWGTWQHLQAADIRAEFESAKARAAVENFKASERASAETARREAAQRKDLEHANELATAALADADRLRATDGRLRERIAAVVAAAGRGDTAAGGVVTSAGDPIGMLADVFGRCRERIRALARHADRARIAGQACEADYDALMVPRGTLPFSIAGGRR
jgi:hypothetical protein